MGYDRALKAFNLESTDLRAAAKMTPTVLYHSHPLLVDSNNIP